MWSKPWSYKEGLTIGTGLLIIGILLQMTVGAINWDLFACPVNVIVLVVYIIALIVMHLLRKRVYLFSWLSHYSAAVSALLWVVGMTVVMGLIRQAPSGHAPNASTDLLGFSQMIASWPFVLLYFWMVTALGLTILRASFPFKWRRLSFLLVYRFSLPMQTAAVPVPASQDWLKNPAGLPYKERGNCHSLPNLLWLFDSPD